jgi:hypothetical protein
MHTRWTLHPRSSVRVSLRLTELDFTVSDIRFVWKYALAVEVAVSTQRPQRIMHDVTGRRATSIYFPLHHTSYATEECSQLQNYTYFSPTQFFHLVSEVVSKCIVHSSIENINIQSIILSSLSYRLILRK